MKRILSFTLAAALALCLCGPVLAAEEASGVRLTEITLERADKAPVRYVLTYGGTSAFPTEIRRETEGSEPVCCTYIYDDEGRVLSSRDELDVLHPEKTYTYDGDGNLLSLVTEDAIYHTEQTYTYDEAGHLTGESCTRSADEEVVYESTTEYMYDAGGRRTGYSMRDSDGAAEQETYVCDEAGNRTSSALVMVLSDGTSRVTDRTYTYDADGNQTSAVTRTNTAGSEVTTRYDYAYDSQGRLTEERFESDAMSYTTAYAYAPCVRYSLSRDEGESAGSFSVLLWDGAETLSVGALSLAVEGEPELAFDDGGRLLTADAGDGGCLRFTYAPAQPTGSLFAGTFAPEE